MDKIVFYRTGSGRTPVLEFVETLGPDARHEFSNALSLLEQGVKLSLPVSRPLFGVHFGLHELRLRDGFGIYRVFYLLRGSRVIILHAFNKKTQEIPKRELNLILRRIREVLLCLG